MVFSQIFRQPHHDCNEKMQPLHFVSASSVSVLTVNSLAASGWVCRAQLISEMSTTPDPSPASKGYKRASPGLGEHNFTFLPSFTSLLLSSFYHSHPAHISCHVSPVCCKEPDQNWLQCVFCLHPECQQLQLLLAFCIPRWKLQFRCWLWKICWRFWKQEPPQSWWMQEDLHSWKRWWLLWTCRFWCWRWDPLRFWWCSRWCLRVWWWHGWPWIPCCPSWGHP